MRRLLVTIAHGDRGLTLLVVGLVLTAALCRLAMCRTDPLAAARGKTILTICRSAVKRDRLETRELKAAFEARHPDIFLHVIQSNLERKPDTMIAAGVAPDLVFVGVDKVNFYLEGDALLDLTPFVEADPELADLRAAMRADPEAPPTDFFPQAVEPFVRERDGQRRLYAMPVNYTPFIVYYSKDLFDRYNVPYPAENWTWEDLREKARALTRDRQGRRVDQPGFDPNQIVCYGFSFALWQHGVETFIRQNGGRLVSEDGTRIVADDHRTVEALQFLFDLKYRDGVVPSLLGTATEAVAFSKGNVAMFLWGVFEIARLNEQAPDLDWDVAPLPRGPTGQRASVIYTNAWGISRQCRHPEAAFRFLKFLVSREGMTIMRRREVFLPVRRSMIHDSGLVDPQRRPRSTWALTHDVDHGYAQGPFSTRQYYGDIYEIVNERLRDLLEPARPQITPIEAAAAIARQGNSILRRDQSVSAGSRFGLVAVCAGILATAGLLAGAVRRSPGSRSPLARRDERWGYALISPWVLGFVLFAAFPIAASLLLSFSRWQSLSQFTQSEFVGWENYRVALSGEDYRFWPSLWVTVRYAGAAVPAGLVAGLALALLMNQRVRGITLFRTLFYLPAILPSVASAVLWWHLFHHRFGWINRVLEAVNVRNWLPAALTYLGIRTYPIGWLNDPAVLPAVFVIISLWTVGGGMIIYLAGLQAIPTQLYEAAQLDGAGRWKQLRHVTLPMLSPVIFFNLVMGIIGSFQVFNVAFVLFDGETGPGDAALFYGLHLFREAFFKYRLGYASALAWILFAIVLALTALVFKSSPLWVYYESTRPQPADAGRRARLLSRWRTLVRGTSA